MYTQAIYTIRDKSLRLVCAAYLKPLPLPLLVGKSSHSNPSSLFLEIGSLLDCMDVQDCGWSSSIVVGLKVEVTLLSKARNSLQFESLK